MAKSAGRENYERLSESGRDPNPKAVEELSPERKGSDNGVEETCRGRYVTPSIGAKMSRERSVRPEDCRDMTEIRAGIDALDREIVHLLGERSRFVHEAAKFKTSASSVRAEDRQIAMLQDRRTWAQKEDLDPDFVQSLYELVVSHFVRREFEDFETSRNIPSTDNDSR